MWKKIISPRVGHYPRVPYPWEQELRLALDSSCVGPRMNEACIALYHMQADDWEVNCFIDHADRMHFCRWGPGWMNDPWNNRRRPPDPEF